MRSLLIVAALISIPMAAEAAQKAAPIKFGKDGCWHYVGSAYQFVGNFKAGTFLTMDLKGAISADTEGDESQWDLRDPMLLEGAFVTQTSPGGVSYVPISKTGRLTVTFMPMSSFGWRGRADICVIGSPPA